MPRRPIAEIKKEIQKLRAKENKSAKGAPVITPIEEVPNSYFLRRPSGIMALDVDTGGGLPAGGLCYVSGPDNCLAGTTLIHQEVRTPEGVRTTHKWITLERLYERFHRLPHAKAGKGNHALAPEGHTFHVPSMNDDLGIVQNKIVDVVRAGEKECFELITEGGQRIEATAEHKFFNGQTYVRLGDLREGGTIYVHNNTRKESDEERTRLPERKMFYVKYHPTARKKDVRDGKTEKVYAYHVLPRARAVVEAAMNDMSLESYIDRLNDGWKLKHLTSDQIVHHLDEDILNDTLENLLVTDRAEHMREHLKDKDRDNYFRFVATPDTITSIESVGLRMTYDLKMSAPYHNFVANGFVVHNSGKTYLLHKYMAMNQRLLGERSAIAYGVSEGPPDHWFMRKCGVKVAIPEKMIEEANKSRKEHDLPTFTKAELAELRTQVGHIEIVRHATGEKLLDSIIECVHSKAFDIVCLDSVSALLSESEARKDLDENPQQAAVATSMTRFFQHYLATTTGFHGENETTVIFTAQARSNKKKSEAAAHFAKYMRDWTTTGAWAARHGKLIDITVWSGGKEKEEVMMLGDDGKQHAQRVAVGKDINWEITKGKAGTHDGITGEVPFSYEHFTDDLRGIVIEGMRHGCIFEKSGLLTVIRKATGTPYEGMTDLAGIDRLIELMKEDFEVELFVRREVLASAGIQCTYR